MVSGYVVVRGGGLLRAQRRRLAGDPLAYHLAAQSRLPPHLGTQPLPPGDALNALTIGATHSDGLGDIDVPDTAWDITHQNAPAHYSATGPGVDRSVKPDLHHVGGRALYARPVTSPAGQEIVTLELAPVSYTHLRAHET